ncbi:hypothetical protein FPK84_27070, partial [Acinetobacter baumannii]|nr:hypothetical protein [Acinetobacter baumannii]
YQLIDQARSTPVRQFRGLVAPGGAKKSFSKGKGKPKGKKAADDTAPPPQYPAGGREDALPHGHRFSASQANGLH